MHNKDIRPEWVPSAYREEVKADVKMQTVKTALYAVKGIYSKQGLSGKALNESACYCSEVSAKIADG